MIINDVDMEEGREIKYLELAISFRLEERERERERERGGGESHKDDKLKRDLELMWESKIFPLSLCFMILNHGC